MSGTTFNPADTIRVFEESTEHILNRLPGVGAASDAWSMTSLLLATGQLDELARQGDYIVTTDIAVEAAAQVDLLGLVNGGTSISLDSDGPSFSVNGGALGFESIISIDIGGFEYNRVRTGSAEINIGPFLLQASAQIISDREKPGGGYYRPSGEVTFVGGLGTSIGNLTGGITITQKFIHKDEYIDQHLASKLFGAGGFFSNADNKNILIRSGLNPDSDIVQQFILNDIKSVSVDRSDQSIFLSTVLALYKLTGDTNFNWNSLLNDAALLPPSRQTFGLSGGAQDFDAVVRYGNEWIDLAPQIRVRTQ